MNRSRITSLTLVALLCGVGSCSSSNITGAGESYSWKAGATASHAVQVNGRDRTYDLHVPPRRLIASGVPIAWPLVIVLHGSSASAADILQETDMNFVADSALFLVAYPNGSGGNLGLFPSDWNAGSCCGGASRDNVDDLGFLTAMINSIGTRVAVNKKKVYVVGFSAGARMAYHAGCQLSASIAAIGVVSGSLVDDACTPPTPVPLFAVHGTDDQEVLFDEAAPTPTGTVPPLAASLPPAVQYWAAWNKCTGGAQALLTPHVTRTRFTKCATATTDIDFYTIDGGTHGWPGGPLQPGSLPPMNELSTSKTMWAFLTRHTHS